MQNKLHKMANNILKGKRGIIFGALDSKSIAWKVAQHAHARAQNLFLQMHLSVYVWEQLTN